MAYARKVGDAWQEIANGFTFDGFGYSSNWAEHATAPELAAVNAAQIVEAGAAPADEQVLGQAITDVGGVPHRTWTTAAYSLAEARAIVWERVKALRETKANGSAATPFGHRADSDSESRLRISGAVQLADKATLAGVPFAISWTMADNVLVPLDAEGMNALGIAVGQHYAGCYTRAQELRTAIAASTAPFDIDIENGWPA